MDNYGFPGICLLRFTALNASAEPTLDAQLKQMVIVTLGDLEIPLATGTAVQVLQKNEKKVVIRFMQ
jgi:hypothetical protein